MRKLTCAFTLAAVAAAAELPVKEVVLFKNGIGYFVRSGDVGAGEQARLEFKADEMNDVLKSLTIVDSTGKVSGLRYESNEPAGRKLGRFPFQLGSQAPLAAVLDQVKGARVELKTGAEIVAGTIVGARETQASLQQPPRQELTILTSSASLRVLDLSGFSNIRFTDPKIQAQFADYLAVLAAGHSRDKRSITVAGDEKSARKVTVSYVVPAPVWKSSYRLVLEEGAPTLEGWAMVDNTSGEDWQGVRLSLISGRPVSFVSNLYAPRYVERQVAQLPEEEAAAPELHDAVVGGVPGGVAGGVIGGIVGSAPQAAPPPPPPPRVAMPAPRALASKAIVRPVTSNAPVQATGVEAGELFEYRFSDPVTVRKGESTMVPFVGQKIAGRKLLVYTQLGGEHPRNAVELTNSTGKTLDGGPITVFDGGSYAGEALMETLKDGDKRLISYAVDIGSRVAARSEVHGGFVREAHLRRGVLTTRFAVQDKTSYEIRNVDAKPKALLLEHPLRPDFKLIGAKPAETTASAYRFEIKLAPHATVSFPIAEERLFEETIAATNLTDDSVASYVQNKDLPDAARRTIERIAAEKRRIAANDEAIAQTERQIAEAARDEERLRLNISSLSGVSGQQDQVQKYARQLDAMETQISGLRDRSGELRKTKTALQAGLDKLIEENEF